MCANDRSAEASNIMKSQKITRFLATFVMASAALAGWAYASELAAAPVKDAYPGRGAEIVVEGIELDALFAPIRAWSHLENYLETPRGLAGPFAALSDRGVKKFLDSLVFTEKGLASFDGDVLVRELSASQIYELLGLFGLERAAPVIADKARFESPMRKADGGLCVDSVGLPAPVVETMRCPLIENHQCAPPATCRYLHGARCITCNCGMIPP